MCFSADESPAFAGDAARIAAPAKTDPNQLRMFRSQSNFSLCCAALCVLLQLGTGGFLMIG
jgi:hypothetical protein